MYDVVGHRRLSALKNVKTRRMNVRATESDREFVEERGGDGGITAGFAWLIRIGRQHLADLARRRAQRKKETN